MIDEDSAQRNAKCQLTLGQPDALVHLAAGIRKRILNLVFHMDISKNEAYKPAMTTHTKTPVAPTGAENNPGGAPIEPELGALLGVFALHNFIESQMDDIDGRFEASHLERKILVWLDQPKRLGTLARAMNVLPSTMTTAADQLESRGLVVRERDADDRRAWLLKLTPAGVDLRSMMVVVARTLLCETLGLSVDELNDFARTSLKIHANIQKHTTC